MKKSKKREEIIAVAKKLILKKGYRSTSIEDITKEMGIAKGSFYTYFKSKDDFILTVIYDRVSQYKIEVQGILDSELTVEEAIKKYISTALLLPLDDIEFFIVFRNVINNIDSLGSESQNILITTISSKYKGILRILSKYEDRIDGKNENELRRLSFAVSGMIDTFYEKTFYPVKFYSKDGDIKTFEQVNEYINSMDMNYEVEFMTKLVLKLILKH